MDERVARRRWPLFAALGLGLYAGFLVMSAPAAVMAWALAHASRGAVTLEAPQAGLWRGRAGAVVLKGPGAAAHRFRDVEWQVLPSQLFLGELAVALRVDDERARGTATLGWKARSLRFSDAALTLSAATIAAFIPALQPVRPGGELAVRSASFVIGQEVLHGEALVEWTDAAVALSAVKPLGTYRARVQGAGAGAHFEVATLAGPLQIEGRGAWTAKQAPTFAGTGRSTSPELRELLRLLGRESADGRFALTFAVPRPPT